MSRGCARWVGVVAVIYICHCFPHVYMIKHMLCLIFCPSCSANVPVVCDICMTNHVANTWEELLKSLDLYTVY